MEAFVEGGGKVADCRLQLFFEESAAQIEIHDGIVGAGAQALAEMRTLFRRGGGAERREHVFEAAGNCLLADAPGFR